MTSSMRGKSLTVRDFINSSPHTYMVIDDMKDAENEFINKLLSHGRHTGPILITCAYIKALPNYNYIFCSGDDHIF